MDIAFSDRDNTVYIEPIYEYSNFSEFVQGNLPIIISIPHGGHLFPDDIPDRKQSFPSVVKSNDINTQEIGRQLFDLIAKAFKGRKPYMVINHLGRSKLDVNRTLKEGAEGISGSSISSDTQTAWNDYHNFMCNAVKEIEESFGRGLLIDIHGKKSFLINHLVGCQITKFLFIYRACSSRKLY